MQASLQTPRKYAKSGCYAARAVERVLVLNASYEPLNVCSLRRAHVLVWKGKAEILEEVLSPTVWRRVTTRVLDRKLFDAELLVGRISTETVAAAVVPAKPIAPYLKVR